MDWIREHDALWGLLALPLALLLALPTLVEVARSARYLGKTTDELHAALRTTRGRRGEPSLKSAMRGIDKVLPQNVTLEDGSRRPAAEHMLRLLASGRSVLVVGSAGSGKSQILDTLHRKSFLEAQQVSDPLVEVVSLGSLSTGPWSARVLSAAVRKIAKKYRMPPNGIRSLISEGKLVIAFDGLDEIEPSTKNSFARQLEQVSQTLPIVVATRPDASGSGSDSDPLDILQFHGGMERVVVTPLTWRHVRSILEDSGVPLTKGHRASVPENFLNPLYLQLFMSMWVSRRIGPAEFGRLVRNPERLYSQFVLPNGAAGTDPALRLAALLSADVSRSGSDGFRPFPLQLGGLAITLTNWTVAVGLFALHAHFDQWVSAIALPLAVLSSSIYVGSGFLGRALMLWTGEVPNQGALLFRALVLSFAIVHVSRIGYWSADTGSIQWGTWSDLISPTWLYLIALTTWFFIGSPITLVRLSSRWHWDRLWVEFAAAAAAALFLFINTDSFTDAARGRGVAVIAYIALPCLYSLFGVALGWMIVGRPPSKWPALLGVLERRGILVKDQTRCRFTHAQIEQAVLWELARNKMTPAVIWRMFEVQWMFRMFSGPVWNLFDHDSAPIARVFRRLAQRDSWALSVTSYSVTMAQQILLEPRFSLRLARKHMMLVPRSGLRPIWVDALDRVDNRAGARAARRSLSDATTPVQVHWYLRVLERHDDLELLVRQVGELLERQHGSPELRDFLIIKARSFAARQGSGRDDLPYSEHMSRSSSADVGLAHVRELLECGAPDLDEAQRILDALPESAVRFARSAQLHLLRGEHLEAKRAASAGVAAVRASEGYDELLETAVTASALKVEGTASTWLNRAVAVGLRLQHRDQLRANLGILAGSATAEVFASSRPVVDTM